MSREGPFVLSVDQGTSGTSASLYDAAAHLVASVDVKVSSSFPRPGWVEQDPFELLESIREAVHKLVRQENLQPGQIECLGLANQGEPLLLWNLETGEPVYDAIGWECVRSGDLCRQMIEKGLEPAFRHRTGLSIHPMWPATKVPWILENVPESHDLLKAGKLAFSSLDTWFIHHLTKERLFVTDPSTASRSGFYNIHDRKWDGELLDLFGGESLVCPEAIDSAGYFGEADFGEGWRIPWTGSALDQSIALLGQACCNPGDTKVTYGTCAELWLVVGHSTQDTGNLSTSIAWQIDGKPTYAIVGEAGTAGAMVVWLRDRFDMSWSNAELSDVAQSAGGQAELVFVAALSGLDAPYWAPHARGTIYGLTAGTGLEHIVKAGLESVAFNVRDVVDSLSKDEVLPISDVVKADGGMAANDYLMQFQADILDRTILVPSNLEATSMGAALLAGLATGYYSDMDFVQQTWQLSRTFEPRMSPEERERHCARWSEAVEHTISFHSKRN